MDYYRGAPGTLMWVDEFADPWGSTGRYGKSIRISGLTPHEFNTEGEKPMARIDWKKPLRALDMHGAPEPEKKVYTFKSGKQRVVWIDDRVYPIDDDGRTVAEVWYDKDSRPRRGVPKGEQIVENVPEEKFFVGLERQKNGTYVLYNGGVPDTREAVWEAARAAHTQRDLWWLVDTRQSAEPSKAIAHDPKDWTVVRIVRDQTIAMGMMTEAQAREHSARLGGAIVRVRETPAPADTARYIQLYRLTPGVGPWKIDGRPSNSPTHEYRWEDTLKNGYHGNEYVHVKVRY